MLRGRLEEFHLTDICRLIANARETGCLQIEGPLGEGAIYFSGGHISHARSSRVTNAFGRALVSRGVLSGDDLLSAVEICTVTGEPLEVALVSYGFVVQDEVQEAVLEQLEQVVLDLFSYPSGRFDFDAGAEFPQISGVSVPVDALIEKVERTASVQRLGACIPVRGDTVVLDLPFATDAVFFSLIDGKSSINEIAATLGIDLLDALRSFYRLITDGLVDVVASDETVRSIDLRTRRAFLSR
jgi:hypothetical protein